MRKKVVIFGVGEFGKMLYEFFTHDSNYIVAGFCVEEEYLNISTLFSLPVVKFENVEEVFPPDEYSMFIAVTFVRMNKIRERLYLAAKEKGYTLVSYINSSSSVWHDVRIGENVVIMECVSLQFGASIGNNVVVWPNTSIGHHCVIEDNCWIASGVAMGVAKFSLIGAGVYINKNTNEYSMYSATGFKDQLQGRVDKERIQDLLLIR